METIDSRISYDIVKLPSQGILYKNKKDTLRVSYLTASDENILVSPNLIGSSKLIDEILKRKILDKDIEIDDLLQEDKEAVLIFLRNTAFGSDYNLTLIDPKTDKEFETTIDLSSVDFIDFKLKPDENGNYDFYLPIMKKTIKFNFLTTKQENEIKKIKESWNGNGPAPIITKQMEFMIKSIDDNTDPLYIKNFVDGLPIKDSQEFRKYVRNNKPGLNLTRTVTTPSGEEMQVIIGFGVEFFRPFYGV